MMRASGALSGRDSSVSGEPQASTFLVLLSVLAIGTCGLLYELLASTLASYLLGDSVTQFSTVIGVYLFAMGVGAWLSHWVDRNLVARFIEIEIAVALIGGLSSALLFMTFARVAFFRVVLYGLVLVIGVLVGLEIPLLMRILKDRFNLRELVARVLTFDYLGALLASLAFPLFLVPRLGLVRGAFFVGVINALVALGCTYLFQQSFRRRGTLLFLRLEAGLTLALLVLGFFYSEQLTSFAEASVFQDPVVYAKNSPYQRIVVTQGRSGFQLYLNGHLQLNSQDEHRYHEALVHPAMSLGGQPKKRILVLGGGDGLAVREVLKHRGVESVTLVDLDPAVTALGKSFTPLKALNQDSLTDSRVRIVHQDAFVWLRSAPEDLYHVVVIDFPDPSSYSLGKLYTAHFYRRLRPHLEDNGVVVVQATSPLAARQSFWCVKKTMEAEGFFVRGYHATVPSFGEWGYFLASKRRFDPPRKLDPGLQLRFLNDSVMASLFVFPEDMSPVPSEVNRLNNQVLVRYYEDEWNRAP